MLNFGFYSNSQSIQMSSDFIHDQKYQHEIFNENDIKFKEFENCTFEYCDFTQCIFLSVVFLDCTFLHCNFNDTKINYVSLRGVEFYDCNFTNVNFAMTDQVIYYFNFTNCRLDFTKFYSLKLKKMHFTGCSLISADFMETDLSETVFDNCDLRRAVFYKTNLSKTDFSTSYHFSIDPEQNKMKKAKFSTDGLKGLLEKYDLVIS